MIKWSKWTVLDWRSGFMGLCDEWGLMLALWGLVSDGGFHHCFDS